MVREFYFDKLILISFFFLIIVGVTFVYSATFTLNDSFYYLKRHLIALSIGLLLGLLAYITPIELWKKNAYLLFIFSFVLLIVVLMLPANPDGAKRWINLFIFNFQPSEFTKFATVTFIASYISRKSSNFRDSMMPIVFICTVVFLFAVLPVAIEPHKGAALYILMITFLMLLSSKFKSKYALFPLLVILPFFVVFILKSQYAVSRFKGMFDSNPISKEGYQSFQSMLSFAKGGIFGEGIGNGFQKLKYLPEIHTDYIFALIGEETGMIGALGVLLLFMVIFYRGIKVSLEKRDEFTSLIGLGVTYLITLNAVAHIMVNLNIAPSTGFTLPFVSYGGSSIIMNCIYMGVLLRVSKEPNRIEYIRPSRGLNG
ncbi:MAG: putative lipid II flippase FtsW [Hydrogenothermaceae bacterium]|nr:putative lipid II flippase FtsW [Hydrogenothermaceae bacterium]